MLVGLLQSIDHIITAEDHTLITLWRWQGRDFKATFHGMWCYDASKQIIMYRDVVTWVSDQLL